MSSKENPVKTFDKQFYKLFVPLMLLIVLFLFFPYFFTTRSWFNIDFSKTGNVGDTIGGILGPFIAIAAAILTFMAFWVQFKANEQQKIDLQIERFENKFYNLIEIHRNNVNELVIGQSTKGRRAYISMFNELKFTYLLVTEYYEKAYKKTNSKDIISDDTLYNIAYLIFFFGTGENSSKVVIDLIGKKNEPFFLCVEEYIKKNKAGWKSYRSKGEAIAIDDSKYNTIFKLDIKYMPCNGHMSKLSHYLRNLFQIVKYIDEQKNEVFSYEMKLQYAGTLRSQLSTHEQLLLYYNAVSVLGKPWIDDGLLENYCLIKSLPLPLADFYKQPMSWLKEKNEHGKTMFEWTDIKSRVNSIEND